MFHEFQRIIVNSLGFLFHFSVINFNVTAIPKIGFTNRSVHITKGMVRCKCNLRMNSFTFSFTFSMYRFLSFGIRPSGSKVLNCSGGTLVKFLATVSILPSLLQRGVFCFWHWHNALVEIFKVLLFSNRVYPRATSAAHHVLYLLAELLIDQSIHNWVDSGIKHDHCRLRDICNITSAKYGRKESHKIGDCSRHPTQCEYGTNCDDHEGDSFPHF